MSVDDSEGANEDSERRRLAVAERLATGAWFAEAQVSDAVVEELARSAGIAAQIGSRAARVRTCETQQNTNTHNSRHNITFH